ncbi:MAG TPA: hypothetical protein VK824_00880 [Planctomycetota bacterium]|nr:hypothetical protein [Planctomycetota bacterium]
MILAISVACDDGTFAVHYAAAKSLEQAHHWLARRAENLKAQGTDCASAVLNTDHVQWIDECDIDEPAKS